MVYLKYLTVNRQAPLPHTRTHTYHWHLVNLYSCKALLCRVLSNSSMSCLKPLCISEVFPLCALAMAERSLFFFGFIPLLMSNSSQDCSCRGNVCRLGKHAVWSLLHSFTVHKVFRQTHQWRKARSQSYRKSFSSWGIFLLRFCLSRQRLCNLLGPLK